MVIHPSKTSVQNGLKVLIIFDKYCGPKCEILVKQIEVSACRSLTQWALLYLNILLIQIIFKENKPVTQISVNKVLKSSFTTTVTVGSCVETFNDSENLALCKICKSGSVARTWMHV